MRDRFAARIDPEIVTDVTREGGLEHPGYEMDLDLCDRNRRRPLSLRFFFFATQRNTPSQWLTTGGT